MPGRPDWDEWAFGIVDAISVRGDCVRRRVGALILGPDHRIWGCGFNGTYPGGPSCLAGACPRGRHHPVEVCQYGCWRSPDCQDPTYTECACGHPDPCPDAVEPGSSYDTGPGACISTHAESNAKADAQMKGYSTLPDAVMFVSCEPCEGCVRDLRNTTQLAAIRWRSGVIGLP